MLGLMPLVSYDCKCMLFNETDNSVCIYVTYATYGYMCLSICMLYPLKIALYPRVVSLPISQPPPHAYLPWSS